MAVGQRAELKIRGTRAKSGPDKRNPLARAAFAGAGQVSLQLGAPAAEMVEVTGIRYSEA